MNIQVKLSYGKAPNYGYGQGPAYVSGQVLWYSAGPQALLVLTDPRYTGPILVRTKRLDGPGSVKFAGRGDLMASGTVLGIPQTSSPPYWGMWEVSITPSAPGCYGIQLDGTNFSEQVVIQVKQGPPPPA